MKSLLILSSFASLGAALSTTNALQKRESGTLSCYDSGNIISFSGWCPTLNWPIHNDRGLQIMETLYFALASTTVPDDTVYYAQENIICTTTTPGPSATVSLGAQVGNGLASAGGSLTFNISFPQHDYSVCMFTQGTDQKNVTDPITLAQARSRLYTLLTTPAVDCKTCGRIPIRNVTDGTDAGGILKIDVIYANNCLGKCVGPNSFKVTTTTTTTTSSGSSIEIPRPSSGLSCFTALVALWLVGNIVA